MMPTRGVARLENAHRNKREWLVACYIVRSGMESRRPRGSLVSLDATSESLLSRWLHVRARALLSVYELALVRCCAVLP